MMTTIYDTTIAYEICQFYLGIVMGSTDQTVRMLFSSVQPVLVALPELLSVAHNYALIVELVLELVATCARQMLIFLPQVALFSKHFIYLNEILGRIMSIPETFFVCKAVLKENKN